ncbi:MAG: ribbon-helix-helix domain-containing protein [Thermodesulfobacteriota bacterium]
MSIPYEAKKFFLDATNVLYYIAFQNVSKGAFLAQTKVARTIYINEEQVEALKKLSEKTKVPQSVYVREALDMLLERYSDQLKIDFGDYFKG